MKYGIQKSLCIMFSFALLLFFTACDKETAKEELRPDSTPQSTASPESVPQEGETEYRTYRIPNFGIEFDCPATFGSDTKSTVISENEASFSVSAEDRIILVSCSRIALMDEWAALASAAGKDSSALYEGFKSLDVADAIATRKEGGYSAFELLDSFSTPDSYGFYYIGTDSFGEAPAPEFGYQYKNYGGFADDNGIINVQLSIVVPETVDRAEFNSLCETVTSSLRLSDAETAGGAPSGVENPALKSLSGSTYDAQCAEIVNMFFEYASLVRYGAPSSNLMLLIGGNEDLFKVLEEPGEILCSSHSFTSELALQDCGENGAGGMYYVNVIEMRAFDEEDIGTHEYAHTFYVSIHSPADYCVTGIDSAYIGLVDTSYHGPDYAESSGLDEPDELDEFDTMMEEYYQLAREHTYGANARIDPALFVTAVGWIEEGDDVRANERSHGMAYDPDSSTSASLYSAACSLLFEGGYWDTPLYELALHLWRDGLD